MSEVLLLLADGFEEIEAISIIDVLRRADIKVDVCSVSNTLVVTGAHHIRVEADGLFESHKTHDYAMIVLPGGIPGVEKLSCTASLIALLKARRPEQWLAAICAAPARILAAHQLLDSALAITGYPALWHELPQEILKKQRVVRDDKTRLISSQGPGSAIEFALTLVEVLRDKASAQHLSEALLVKLN